MQLKKGRAIIVIQFISQATCPNAFQREKLCTDIVSGKLPLMWLLSCAMKKVLIKFPDMPPYDRPVRI